MVVKRENNRAGRNEAEAILAAALAQLDAIKRAQAIVHSSALDSAAGSAKDAIANIRSAMQSGNVDASTLASLSAGLNLGVDVSTLEAEATPSASVMAANAAVAAAAVESHKVVERLSDDMFRKQIFEADVERHTHGAELEAYKKRQVEDEQYVREQLGKHTPEGDLNASGKMQGAMLDADAHGAGDNPEFIKRWEELKTKTGTLRASMKAAGKSTDEYDKHLREDVTAFLKSKGLSDLQIKETLAKSDDPLDAVKPYLKSDKDSQHLAESIRQDGSAEQAPQDAPAVTAQAPSSDKPLVIDTDAMNARLAALGLGTNSPADDGTGHGLTIQKPQTSPAIVR